MGLGVYEIEFIVHFCFIFIFKSYLYRLRQSKNVVKYSDCREAVSGTGLLEVDLWEKDSEVK